jgi:hypothetical protein
MNKVKLITGILHASSFMLLVTAVAEFTKRAVSWIKNLGKVQGAQG